MADVGEEFCFLNLPGAPLAGGYRAALTERSRFQVVDFGSGVVGVAPAEGAGAVCEYFTAHRLCDAASDFSDPMLFDVVAKYPPYQRPGDPAEHRDRALAEAQRLGNRPAVDQHAHLAAFALAVQGYSKSGELPAYLAAEGGCPVRRGTSPAALT